MDSISTHNRIKNEFGQHRFIADQDTYRKIQRHLTVFNDQITDDDIRNVKISIGGKQAEELSRELENAIRGL